jgi:AraC-like DNA-binding protein
VTDKLRGSMQDHMKRPAWIAGAEYVPQMFHRTDSFRFLEPGGRIAVHPVVGGQMVLARVRSTGHDITLEEPERLTLLFPWAGRITCTVRDERVGADADGMLTFAPNLRRTVVTRPDRTRAFQADVVTLTMTGLIEAQRAEGLTPGRFETRQKHSTFVLAGIRRRVAMVLTEDECGRRMFGKQATFEDLVAELAQAFAESDRPAPSAGRRRVSQAITLMQAHHAEQFSIVSLARDLGCSSRSLQAAFREAGLATPQETLADIRLDAARVKLLSGGQSVTQCALDSGISHLGRLARAYRRRFGEGPGQTLAAQN